jgi:FAD/FMN-containing dehydrogenase
MLSLIALDPRGFATAPAVAAAVMEAAKPWLAPITNANFGGDLARQTAFDAAWSTEQAERLRAVRADYDPNHVFAFGPAASVIE